MSDEKSKPVDDLKQGLNLLFRAAKGAVDKIPTEKIEGALKDGAKEVGKAFETVANEVDKVFQHGAPQGQAQPPEPTTAEGIAQAKEQHDAEEKKNAPPEHFDDAYGPEPTAPPKGPRVG
jgi:hypothetical protein